MATADLPTELRESAGRVAHAVYRAAATSRTVGDTLLLDPLLADWPDLTDAQRELFRANQDAALSVVWPVLRQCAVGLGAFPMRGADVSGDATAGRNLCPRCVALAHLAALGVRP